MRRVCMACVGLAALAFAAAPAAGADLPPRYPQPYAAPAYAPIYNWTGFYFGINGGGGWGQSQWDGVDKFDISGGLIGGTIGYNAQNLGPFIVSEEFDFSWRKFNFTIPAATCMPNCNLQSNWVSTARLRFGYAIDRFMPYVTGGLSMSDFNSSAAGAPFGPANNVTFNWVAGGGVEFIIDGPWSGKVEYLYANHTRFACVVECNGPVNLGVSESIFRVGVNYRLGGW